MANSVPCVHCGTFITPRNRDQNYCPKPQCQRARKTQWERNRRKSDPEYKQSRQISQKKWLKKNPAYWKDYRHNHPKKDKRNRVLQKIRNRKKSLKSKNPVMIAKVDARKSLPIQLSGPFWLIPDIAKVDAVKIYFHSNSEGLP
jgi:hypothetical protein